MEEITSLRVFFWELVSTSLHKGVGFILPLCAVYLLYRLDSEVRDIKSLRATVLALNIELTKKDGDIWILKAELQRKEEGISVIREGMEEKDKSISAVLKQVAEKDGIISLMKAEIEGRATKAELQLEQEIQRKGRSILALQAEVQQLVKRLEEAWLVAEKAEEMKDWQSVTKDSQIEQLTLDARILEEKLVECNGRLENLQAEGKPLGTLGYWHEGPYSPQRLGGGNGGRWAEQEHEIAGPNLDPYSRTI
ncbi:hypothetical protein DFP72DRAFT_1165601 [Ephemerocybe angulata]|uniref:Uncharacterized protein n=1 Tax=Ephemerocybe angulata TaxID=980116 RepID=A0A8H6IBG4_9AGAR|nr:hypothetical protein DFP72DRAFT_1165601 [Tulosesus angulatus]